MKQVILMLLGLAAIVQGEVREVSAESGLRKVMFDLLRPEIATQAGKAASAVKFQGSLKREGKWAFFSGRSLEGATSISFEPMGNDDTCALWLETRKGWILVDWSAGHSDVFYLVWAEEYGVPEALLGLAKP
ncbi:MAG: hypothetical protein Q7Q71_05445 [Verrucomicrobiota bacterium JB023]|nr:hypothetical protein [Verrucomicrobiota bacterium JB023]